MSARLTKALFYNELHQSHPVIESHACSHAIVGLTNDRDHLLWHATKGERSSEEGSINGVVRFGKVDKAYIKRARFFRANTCRCRITYITSVVKQFGLNPLCFYGRIPTRSIFWLRRRAMIVSSILLACTTSEIPLKLPHSFRSFVLLSTMIMAYFHCCGTPPPPNTNDYFEQSSSQAAITVDCDLEQLNGTTGPMVPG